MDFLKIQSPEQLKDMKTIYENDLTRLYGVLDEQKHYLGNLPSVEERVKETQATITECKNTITLLNEYIDYRTQPVNLTSQKPIKSFKATCGKSVRKSAEKHINDTKDFVFGTIKSRMANKKQTEIHPDYVKYADNFEDFEQEVESGAFMRENMDNSAPEEWSRSGSLRFRTAKMSSDVKELKINVNTIDEIRMPYDINDFAAKFSELKFGTTFQEDKTPDESEYWTKRRYSMTKEQLDNLGIEDADTTINGLLKPVHFDENDNPISEQDKVNHLANLEVKQGLSEGGKEADLTYMKAFQRKVLELLRLELKPEQLSYDFLIKNPEYFARINMYGKLFTGYKNIKDFERNFPRSYAFIKKYMLPDKINKSLIGQLINSKLVEAQKYCEEATAIIERRGFKFSSGKFKYEFHADGPVIDTIDMNNLNNLTQTRKALEARLQREGNMSQRTREMTTAYKTQMNSDFAALNITEPTPEQIEAYKTYNMRKSISDNPKYASLIAEIQKKYPAFTGVKLSSLILWAQLVPYQNVKGDPVTEEDEEIYNENIEKLRQFAEGEVDRQAPENSVSAGDCMGAKGLEYYVEMAHLPEITEADVSDYINDPVMRIKFAREIEGKILCFSYYAGDNGATPLSEKWSDYKPDAEGNTKNMVEGVSWEKLNDKIDVYRMLAALINFENRLNGYNFDSKTWWKDPDAGVNADSKAPYIAGYENAKTSLFTKINDYNKKYHAQQ